MPTLTSLVTDHVAIDAIAAHLDGLSPDARLAEVRALPARAQASLFELARGRACTIDRDYTPNAAPLSEVIHEGRNSLPAFRYFQKRFARLPGTVAEAGGFNEQAMRPFTGPGYFVAREDLLEGVSTVVIDYKRVPPAKAAGWPEIRPNGERLSRFIYQGTEDWMWRVSEHVTIGRARRASGWMDNWFVLCRTPLR